MGEAAEGLGARMAAPDGVRSMMIGRTRETGLVDEVLARLGTDRAPAVLDFTGDAGIGKSRLLAELCTRARQAGLTVLRGRATEYEQHIPFQAFTDAFADADLGALDRLGFPATCAPVLRGAADAPAAGPQAPDRFGLYRAVADVTARLGADGLVMVLDDLHWADPASRELVDYLVRHPVHGRVLLAVARRDRQTPTSLAATLSRGVDNGVVLRLTLGPLSEAESIAALAPDLPPHRARELYTASEGNPLYLLALLHAHRHGTPLHGIGAPGLTGWQYRAADVPSGLGALLLDELTALTEPQLRTAEAVAVLGDHATSVMLERTAGHRDPDELRTTLGELAQRDLLRPASGGRWTLRHPLLRALVYENAEVTRRTTVHCKAAEELARSGASVVERAHHLERSLTGWDPSAATVLSEAAQRLADTAPATAAHLLEVVLRMLPDTGEHGARRGELLLARARALGVSGNLRESRDLLHALIGAPGSADSPLRAEAIALCAVMERHLGHSPEAIALLRAELSRSPGPPPEQAVSLGLALGMSALLTVSYPAVRPEMARTLATARAHGDQVGTAGALALSALGETYEGQTEAARRLADEAADLVDALTDPRLTGLCESLVWLSWTEALLERYPQARRHADRGLDIARRSGQIHVLPHLLTSRAFVDLNTCRLTAALEAADEAESVARAIGSSELLAFTLAFTPLIRLLAAPLGDSRALATAEEAVALAGKSDTWWASLARCMLGHTAFVSGDPNRALAAILTAGGGPELHRLQPSIRPAQLGALVGAALATGERDQAERWAERAAQEADRLDLASQHGAALHARAALAEQAGDHAAAVRLLDQAANGYAAVGASLWEAYTLLCAAPLVCAAGDRARARALWQRGRRIAEEGSARLLTDLAELADPDASHRTSQVPAELSRLTARELEIAELAAEGLSNQAIAARLHLSRRTVETHLSAIYRKAEVSSRSALASLITRTGLTRHS